MPLNLFCGKTIFDTSIYIVPIKSLYDTEALVFGTFFINSGIAAHVDGMNIIPEDNSRVYTLIGLAINAHLP